MLKQKQSKEYENKKEICKEEQNKSQLHLMREQKPFGPATAYANSKLTCWKIHEINVGHEAKLIKTSHAGNIKLNIGHEATIYKIIKTTTGKLLETKI